VKNLAEVFCSQGRLEETEQLEVYALEASMRLLGPEYLDALCSMATLANTWKSLGRDEDAIDLLPRAERLQRQVIGLDQPDNELRTNVVVVSKSTGPAGGLIQYDYGKTLGGRFELMRSLNRTPDNLLKAVSSLNKFSQLFIPYGASLSRQFPFQWQESFSLTWLTEKERIMGQH
jgi:hypothetical protein